MPLQQVPGQTNFSLTIPVTIKADAQPCETELKFRMAGPWGALIGETLVVPLSVLEKFDEVEIYKRVIKMIEDNKDAKFSFEEALAAFKAAGYNEKRAIEQISKKRQAAAKKFASNNMTESMFKDDDDDDFYS